MLYFKKFDVIVVGGGHAGTRPRSRLLAGDQTPVK